MQFVAQFHTLQAFYSWLAERWKLSSQSQLEAQFKKCHKDRATDGVRVRALKNRELGQFSVEDGEAYMIYSGRDHYLIKRLPHSSGASGTTQYSVEIKKPSWAKEDNEALDIRRIKEHDQLPRSINDPRRHPKVPTRQITKYNKDSRPS